MKPRTEDRASGHRVCLMLKLVTAGEQEHREGNGDESDDGTEAGELRRRRARRWGQFVGFNHGDCRGFGIDPRRVRPRFDDVEVELDRRLATGRDGHLSRTHHLTGYLEFDRVRVRR